MGEHPSPGPAVAACAEAERIEELEPEVVERPPAAPEDVSALFPARANFLGGSRGRAAPGSPPAGPLGGFRVTRESPGLAGSPRAREGGGTGLPETRAPPPAWAPRASLRNAAPAAVLGTRRPPEPPPRGWCSAWDTAFSRRGGSVTAVAPSPPTRDLRALRVRGRSGRRRVPRTRRRRPVWRPPSPLPD
eukprot:bmy_08850T0